MLTNVSQRWRAGRDKYRPAGEVIDTPRHEWTPAKRLRLDQVKTALARLEAISEG